MSAKPFFLLAWHLLSLAAVGQNIAFTERDNPGKLNWADIASSSDGTKLIAAAYDGSVYTSTTGGAGWITQSPAGTRNWSAVTTSSDGLTVGMVGGGDVHRGLFQSGSFAWTPRNVSGRQRYWQGLSVSSDGSKWIILDEGAISSGFRDGGEIFTSQDQGGNWLARPNAGKRNWYRAATSADGLKLLASERHGQVYRSGDAGSTWEALTIDGSGGKPISDVVCSADGTTIIVSTANAGSQDIAGKIFVSANSGATWVQRNPQSVTDDLQQWKDLAVSDNGMIIYAVSSFGYVYSSVNQGQSWNVHETTSVGGTLKLHWKAITCSANGLKVAACAWNQGIFTAE